MENLFNNQELRFSDGDHGGGPMISNKNTVSHPKSLSKQMTKSTTSEGNSTLLSV